MERMAQPRPTGHCGGTLRRAIAAGCGDTFLTKLANICVFFSTFVNTPFTNKRDAIDSLRDIEDIEELSVEEYKPRKLVADTDWGAELKERVRELKDLLDLYENGVIAEKLTK